ncbi:Uroporphyrinogen decarboxylase like protein [Verticillium longisporum]|uniref:Uroporphyrinogen decarboxylase n=1 Tax=Verticillium longisporum TaxID=100787 RepID=A0A8I2Z6R4_VERLO|nr:Uroporphyrinogen decarboxylase like protein [Verticillium longisporum]
MAHDFPPLKNDLLLRAARGEVVERPPCWIMRQAGRYLPEYHEAKGTNDFFALLDAAIIFSDILVIPQALGMTVEMYASVMAVDLPTAAAELDYVYKAITMTRHKLAGRVPLIGFCGAPWTLLCYMVEGGGTKLFIQSKKWVYRHADAARALLQKIADLCVEYLALQVQAGAQAVMVFDSWAGELGPREFALFSEPYLAHIAAHLPAKLRSLGLDPVPMTVFPKGAWHALGRACELGYDAVGIDWMQDPAEAVRIRGDRRVALQGNADPGVLYGTKEEITRAAQVMVDGFWKEKKGWICNLGHGITPGVNPDDLKFFLSEVHRLTQQ